MSTLEWASRRGSARTTIMVLRKILVVILLVEVMFSSTALSASVASRRLQRDVSEGYRYDKPSVPFPPPPPPEESKESEEKCADHPEAEAPVHEEHVASPAGPYLPPVPPTTLVPPHPPTYLPPPPPPSPPAEYLPPPSLPKYLTSVEYLPPDSARRGKRDVEQGYNYEKPDLPFPAPPVEEAVATPEDTENPSSVEMKTSAESGASHDEEAAAPPSYLPPPA